MEGGVEFPGYLTIVVDRMFRRSPIVRVAQHRSEKLEMGKPRDCQTTLVLGAGASAEVGFPIGTQLRDSILKLFDEDDLLYHDLLMTSEELARFRVKFSRSGFQSIDSFLEANPELAVYGKKAIARVLRGLESVRGLFPPSRESWYRHLGDWVVESMINKGEMPPLRIITFNYDRSLECYLYHRLINRLDLRPEKSRKLVESIGIVHVYGMVGEFPDEDYGQKVNRLDLGAISDKVRVISEFPSPKARFCSPDFRTANSYLGSADRIIFLGFGFHLENLRRFRYFSPAWGSSSKQVVRGTLKGFSAEQARRLVENLRDFGLQQHVSEFHRSLGCEAFLREYPLASS